MAGCTDARSAKREGGRDQVDSRRFERLFFGTAILGLLAVAVPTVVIDPFFHYHGPQIGRASCRERVYVLV